MATTIKSVDLDFDNIKNRLKEYLETQTEFSDYDFDASGLSNILDVLAYNTHINALTANFSINESFLSSAQLRSSVVSHAETLGYDVRSSRSAVAYLNLSLNLSGVVGRPPSIELANGTTFTSSINGTSYTFRTMETFTAKDNGSGLYEFKTSAASLDIPVIEGTLKTKTFYAPEKSERQIYVIPDSTIDKSTAVVKVFDTASSSNYRTYYPLTQAVEVSAVSEFFTIRETPNGQYELNFGDGTSFGKSPDPGNKIVVEYLSSSGPSANAGTLFVPSNDVRIDGIDYTLSSITASASTGGAEKQSIESIRQLAPIAFATQQRLVTSLDYKAIILSNYTQIRDVAVWSGDENDEVNYGKVYVSLNFQDNTPAATQQAIKDSIVSNFAENLSVMSIDIIFIEPLDVFVECDINFDFDPALTGQSIATTETQVFNFLQTYFNTNLNLFNKVFRKSNLATEIDALDGSILSSRIDVKTQMRFTPLLNTLNTISLKFPNKIRFPSATLHHVQSTVFEQNGVLAQIKNELGKTKLQVVDLDGNILLDNVGNYEQSTGIVNIVGFQPEVLIGGVDYIKISVTPEIENTLTPLKNYILKIDTDKSSATANIDRQTTSLKVTI
jgi:hypothetical protein